MDSKANQLCDTLPPAKLAATTGSESGSTTTVADPPRHSQKPTSTVSPTAMAQTSDDAVVDILKLPPSRKLCVRHQRMADEGTNTKLQQSLEKLPVGERQAVNAIWSSFSSASHPRRAIILQGLLTMCCFSQLSLLAEQLAHLIRIDPFMVLPQEVGLRILGYLDATSLCRASQVSRLWRKLADDDALWKGICEQHIGQKCHKCGWGLPVLESRRHLHGGSPGPSVKRKLEGEEEDWEDEDDGDKISNGAKDGAPNHRPKRQKLARDTPPPLGNPTPAALPATSSRSSVTRLWKDVYSERMTIERNWRRGRCTVRILKGHTDGVMCLQFRETFTCPEFPVLISGSYDTTARVWNLETGAQLHVLRGHQQAVRALQFDECKLITGSLDSTLKVWDWRRGTCVRTLTGHSGGVIALNFDNNVLASGSVDTTIKVWNFRTGSAFTLRGHQDWVNAVQLWDSNPYYRGSKKSSLAESLSDSTSRPGSPLSSDAPQIDPGKMLFTGSDDGTMRLWDLTSRTCVRVFTGHVGQVQTMALLLPDECEQYNPSSGGENLSQEGSSSSPSSIPSPPFLRGAEDSQPEAASWPLFSNPNKPVLISGSLDNTIKMWDIDTGAAVRTFFGHIEGIWGVSADKLRLTSGSHDRTIKLWSRETTSATATLVGHKGAVCCIQVGEDKIVSGSDDHDIRVWSFAC